MSSSSSSSSRCSPVHVNELILSPAVLAQLRGPPGPPGPPGPSGSGGIGGDVIGPTTSTLNGLAYWENTLGTLLASSTITIDPNNLNLGTSTASTGNIKANGATVFHSVGNQNIAAGANALNVLRPGNGNSAYGVNSLTNLMNGANNSAFGLNSGVNYTTESGNLALGNTGTVGDQNVIRLGQNQTKAVVAGIYGTGVSGVPVYINNLGQLGMLTSSEKTKIEIKDLKDSATLLEALKAKSYKYSADGAIEYGLIAEDVHKIDSDLVIKENDELLTVRYHLLPILLLKGWQEQQETIKELTEKLEKQAALIQKLSDVVLV